MRRLNSFDKLITGGALLFAVFIFFSLSGCSKIDEKLGWTEYYKIGKPYKFKIELSSEKPDEYKVKWCGCLCTYVDEKKIATMKYISEIEKDSYASPIFREFDVPSNFIFVKMSGEASKTFGQEDGVIKGKLFVNGKLIAELSDVFMWLVTVGQSTNTFNISVDNKQYLEVKKSDFL